MTEPAVVFDRVWKKFRRGERHDSLRDLIPAFASRLFRRRSDDGLEKQEFWAVEDVSFEVQPGEAVAIIGPNGAGKSTSLKLLTRILRPTRGSCVVRGRVGALIEVAAGFHPDLTGRENIFLQGAIMGMRRIDIARRLDEIVDFAGVGPFIDTQTKRYSSGMNARLGFSIAAHLDPDVLIIDEVLSVGDMDFQQRCVDRMLEFKRRGITIVFVSHDLNAVSKLCNRAVLLNRRVAAVGQTDDVVRTYVRSTARNSGGSSSTISVERVSLTSASAGQVQHVTPGDRLNLQVTYRAHESLDDFHFGFLIHRATDGLLVYDQSFSRQALGLPSLSRDDVVTIDYGFAAHLTRGQYDVELHVYRPEKQDFVLRFRPAAVFQVHETATYAGISFLDVRPRVTVDAVVSVSG